MPTATEKRALGFFAGVLLLGAGVRVVRATSSAAAPPSAAARAALHRQIAAVDSARAASGGRAAKGGKGRRAPKGPAPSPTTGGSAWDADSAQAPVYYLRRPPTVVRLGVDTAATPSHAAEPGSGPSGPAVDVDVAPAAELERLPRIGPALARRIVADREANGPFGSLQALTRVRGIGPATARQLAPYVTFTLSPRQFGDGDGAPGASGGHGRRLRKPRSP
jgi:competence protein ComEA